MHSPRHIDRPGSRCVVIGLIAVHPNGGTVFTVSTHRQPVVITRQGHAVAEAIACIRIGCFDISLLDPDTSEVFTGEEIDCPGPRCVVIRLIAVHSSSGTVFIVSTHHQRDAITRQGHAVTEAIACIRIRCLDILPPQEPRVPATAGGGLL